MNTQTMSTIRRDFVATHLRSQLSRLQSILTHIEEAENIDCDYAMESLKQAEINLHQIRRLIKEEVCA